MPNLKDFAAVAAFGLAVAACGATTDTFTSEVGMHEQVLCDPSPDAGIDTTIDPDLRAEALVLHLTGIDEDALMIENEREEILYDDPNYGGVYGDRNGGIVVAVVDCSLVDADRIAQIAGGPQAVQLIEVPYSFEQVNDYRDALLHSKTNVSINSTTSGRWIVVTVEDFGDLPGSYGSDVPDDVFSVVEGELFSAEAGVLND